MQATVQDHPEAVAVETAPVEPDRIDRCRMLVTVQLRGRSTGAHLGPPTREQCSGEVADPNHESRLCQRHLAMALRDLLGSGAVHLAGRPCSNCRRNTTALATVRAVRAAPPAQTTSRAACSLSR